MKSLNMLRVVGILEAISFLLLLGVAMPLKYVWHLPIAVRIGGSVHGALFVLYVWTLFRTAGDLDWPARRTLMGMVAAVVPAGPILFDRQLHREGVGA